MADWGQEEGRSMWSDLSQDIRKRHERCFGVKPMPVGDRDSDVLPQVLFFRTGNDVSTVPYPIAHRVAILEL